MLKKVICLSIIFICIACTTHSDKDIESDQQSLLNDALLHHNAVMIKKLNRIFIVNKNWQQSFRAYQYLCVYSDLPQNCDLMWATATKTHNNSILFNAAATHFNIKQTPYWLNKLEFYASTDTQILIIKVLKSELLSDIEIDQLTFSKVHHAQALYLKGKFNSDIGALNNAGSEFITLKKWESVGDSFALASKVALHYQKRLLAEQYYSDALIYYDLLAHKNKLNVMINWGVKNGLTR
ncbi:hypothetical protein [Pseudoalteromonas denitrificans]|uniref:Uncharacterized protein n=1 Tax=Pseudoalteromonas denitrificans DSM 6059 TaxID=1123010 RepID=A0A1I1FNV0_9GAMM|nr:hypothetical protein [Pseudoalteromonas denitrificans]SFB98700.1 hypothetical protein SAMN02745724_00635 [Pseudoalteromonas denitrificans DSM 6059]